MKQRIFLIHGWGGSPRNDWFPWAKKELTQKGFEVVVPEMPETEHPKINSWVSKLSHVVGKPQPTDILIGHSIGCQTILRYLENLDAGQKVEKNILIAPWWFLTLDENEEQADADPWLNTQVNFENIKTKADKFICVFSENDPFVPLNKNVEFFKKNLRPEILIKGKSGHITESDGFTKLEFLPDLIK
jgi:uncharacterized protein